MADCPALMDTAAAVRINAIEAGDPDLAEAAGRHHVLSVRYETNRRQRGPSGPPAGW